MKSVTSGFQYRVLFIPTLLLAQAWTRSVDIEPLKNELAGQEKLLDGVIA